MKNTKDHYYFDMTDENYNYVIRNCNLIKRKKEKQILDLCIQGKTNKEISKETGYAITTIINRKRDIYNKIKKYLLDYDNENLIDDINLYKIYKLTFPNNKIYIGMTSKNEEDRWKNGFGYINNEEMYNDILQYGWINIKKEILNDNLLYKEAKQKETELIVKHKSYLSEYGYNKKL